MTTARQAIHNPVHLKPCNQLFTGLLLSACLVSPVSGQNTESIYSGSIIFEPELVTSSPAEAYATLQANHDALPEVDMPAESGIPSTPDDTASLEQLDSYEDRVNQLIDEEGIYSQGLIETYLTMADIFADNKQPANAYEAYSSALHIIRIRNGLNTEKQIPILEAQAKILMELGLLVEAQQTLESLRNVQLRENSRNPDALIVHRLAYARDMLALSAKAYHRQNEQLSDQAFVLDSLIKTRNELRDSVYLIASSGRGNISLNTELYRDLAATNFYLETALEQYDSIRERYREDITTTRERYRLEASGSSWNPPPDPIEMALTGRIMNTSSEIEASLGVLDMFSGGQSPLMEGIRVLQSNLDKAQHEEADPETVFEAMINLADYSLVTGYQFTNDAHELYQQAYDFLQQSGLDDADSMLSNTYYPDIPVQIPTYISSRFTPQVRGDSENSQRTSVGFIDVNFRLDRNGHAKRVRVQFRTPELSEESEELLVQNIKRSLYRPAFEGSEPVRKNFELRYYVSVMK